MSATDVVCCMLTALFTAGAVHALRCGLLARGSGWRSRGDHLLHSVMALAMAVMPWNGGGMLPEAQTTFFAAAALWFPLTAVSRHRQFELTDVTRRLPYAAGMAAMAWMTRLGHSTGSMAGDVVTGVLALYLLACALRSLTRDMPMLCRASGTADSSTSIRAPYTHFWHGSMALGTVIMLLMHH
ncbi:DUF5134 domain-containing protein [Streptomyces sp. NPDC096311]|uniref:DUF5134 domain-containing protein n=1 Tax=Streptomyces sp. NPDC096311 TaxID=3366083 RepID=UPI003827F4AF